MIQSLLINNVAYGLAEREKLSASALIDESIPHVLLATCNRMEVYWGEGEVPEDIVKHLYRVASGLESSLVGERAIQGQLKLAYAGASEKYCLSSSMHRLFQSAMYTGRRVRTETKIAEGAISHSQVTVDILKQRKIDLKRKIISIIGVNKLTEDILKFLTSRGAMNIFMSNRNLDKVKSIAKEYNCTAISLDNKNSILEFTDILICATAAPHTIIGKEDIPKDKELLIFDLAFPRDVDENVENMKNVELLNLEDIERFAKENVSLRKNEIHKAERIINEEIVKFYKWVSYVSKTVVI
jgi:glutamyl-tRNA reductase